MAENTNQPLNRIPVDVPITNATPDGASAQRVTKTSPFVGDAKVPANYSGPSKTSFGGNAPKGK